MALTLVEFLFVRLQTVVLKVVVNGCSCPGEFWGMILDSFFIGTLALIILALTKKGIRIMHEKFRKILYRRQRSKHNEQEMKRKSSLAWV